MNYIFCKGLGAKQVTIKLDLEAGEMPFTADVGPTTPSSSDLKAPFPGFNIVSITHGLGNKLRLFSEAKMLLY